MDLSAKLGLIYNSVIIDFIIRLLLNVVSIALLSGFIYLRRYKDNENFFVITIFNILVFFICFLLSNVQLSMGFAFGIFAIFSILRYRTRMIPIKEMTFLFASISLAIINAIHFTALSYYFIIFSNFIIIASIYLLENILQKNEKTKELVYEKIELIKPANYIELLADLTIRTGLNISRIEIGKLNFMKDTAKIKIYYLEN